MKASMAEGVVPGRAGSASVSTTACVLCGQGTARDGAHVQACILLGERSCVCGMTSRLIQPAGMRARADGRCARTLRRRVGREVSPLWLPK